MIINVEINTIIIDQIYDNLKQLITMSETIAKIQVNSSYFCFSTK